jgi:hypothetical protein
MLNSGKKIHALPDKKKYILTLVLSGNFFMNETKNHNPPKSEYFFQQHWESEYFFKKKNHNNPPFQVKWSFPNPFCLFNWQIKYV